MRRPRPTRFTYADPLTLPRLPPAALFSTQNGIIPETPPRRFLRPPPEFHDDPDGAGLFPGFTSLAVEYPENFVLALTNPTLIGYRTFLLPTGQFCADLTLPPEARARHLANLASPDPFLNEETGLRHTAGETFSLANPNRPHTVLDEPHAVLVSAEPYSYGSFLFRILPKLHALRLHRLYDIKLLVHAHIAAFTQLLALAGIDPSRIVQHNVHTAFTLSRAVIPSLRNHHAYLDPETLDLFAGLRARFGRPQQGRKLYISRLGYTRAGHSPRVMLNEPDLIAALAARGFEIIEPETLTARQQIETFSSASLIVAPAGSALFNTVFCHPGTRIIDIESEPHWIHAHTCLFASLSLPYGILEARTDPTDPAHVHRRFHTNIPALLARLASAS